MSKDRGPRFASPEQIISLIGPGMTVVGDCETDGALRIEGKIQGNVRAGKSVVVGKEGVVEGDIHTQDAIISGVVRGTVRAESRLEIQASSRIEGDIWAGRMQLEEGAHLTGSVRVGPSPPQASPPPPPRSLA